MTQISEHERFVGIDVAKKHLDVHLLPEGKSWRIDYTPAGLARLLDQLEKVAPTLIAMEASGGYERACADCLAGAGLAVAVINPRLVRRFSGSLGKLAKTDQIDAAMIARYAAFAKPDTHHTPDRAQAMLMALTTRRRQLVGMIVMEKQRTDPGHAHPAILAGIKRHLRVLEKALAKLEAQIDTLIAGHPLWARMTTALQTVTGVGRQTATALITHLPEIGTLTRRQAAALAGLAPINRDSGTHRGRRFVQGGRQPLKTALYLAALSAANHHPILKTFYQSLKDNGKAPKSALIAVARKLLIILNAIARDTIATP
jgi:transposase